MKIISYLLAIFLLAHCCFCNAQQLNNAILLSSKDEYLDNALVAEIVKSGYAIEQKTEAELIGNEVLQKETTQLLVIPDACSVTKSCAKEILCYLKKGGDIIALNAPLWLQQERMISNRWLSVEQSKQAGYKQLIQNLVLDFKSTKLDAWIRSSNNLESKTFHEIVSSGPVENSNALHVTITNRTGWDTFTSPNLSNFFPQGHTLTVFYAKGDRRTIELMVEWQQKDGSRWIATVPLTEKWQFYILDPQDFKSYPRGHAGSFQPSKAVRIGFGLAFTHVASFGGGRHEYWVGPVGTAAKNVKFEKILNSFESPKLDTLCPSYKLFSTHEVSSIQSRKDQVMVNTELLPLPKKIKCSHPRATAAGFDKKRNWRWIPLLQAENKEGKWRGNPAAMMVHADGSYENGVWASLGLEDEQWYKDKKVINSIGQIAASMKKGVFLVDAGTNFYRYFQDQTVTFGANLVNTCVSARSNILVKVTLRDIQTNQTIVQRQWKLNLAAYEKKRVSEKVKIKKIPKAGIDVVVELFNDNELVDIVRHKAYIWQPKKVKNYISSQKGDFVLSGKRWLANGVNYMPSSGVACEDNYYFEKWLSKQSYDPEVIDRDLRNIKDMGLNAVSIFIYHENIKSQNLLDFLCRADALGLKVNLSLRPGTPMDFEWDKIREIIEYNQLWEHDCIFALDLAWEPKFGDHNRRKQWDRQWSQWVTERYGSIEKAQKDWGVDITAGKNSQITNPKNEQMVNDGPWRKMVAAYRRFLDTLLYEKYSKARSLVKSLDPYHMVSFRMADAGNPTYRFKGVIPYDFPYLAAAVDIFEPEAYGRLGEWEQIRPGKFLFEYARWADPNKPLIWAEAGVSCWVRSKMQVEQSQLEYQASFYRNFYRMISESGADGVFFWWYPGGFRAHEYSDYGVINPDGSDRHVTGVIRKSGKSFLAGKTAPKVTDWITIDRDLHPAGLAQVYKNCEKDFWAKSKSGSIVGLQAESDGSTSADCSLKAVGNGEYDGSNPPKFLDGFFDRVEVLAADGNWVNVNSNDRVKVSAKQPVMARVSVTNLGQASWLSPKDTSDSGRVYIVAKSDKQILTPIPLDIAHLGSTEIKDIVLISEPLQNRCGVCLRFCSLGRAEFGPKFKLILRPDTTER